MPVFKRLNTSAPLTKQGRAFCILDRNKAPMFQKKYQDAGDNVWHISLYQFPL
jgi:hypothetical protein